MDAVTRDIIVVLCTIAVVAVIIVTSRRKSPWDEAPPWAVRLNNQLELMAKKEAESMSRIEDALTEMESAAERNANQENAVMDLLVKLSKVISDLRTGTNDPALIARIDAAAAALNSKASALAAAIVANPADEPQPQPQPQPVQQAPILRPSVPPNKVL